MEIEVIGTQLKVVLNGDVLTEFDGDGYINTPVHKALGVGEKGYIALQLHSDDIMRIGYKDIYIQDLGR